MAHLSRERLEHLRSALQARLAEMRRELGQELHAEERDAPRIVHDTAEYNEIDEALQRIHGGTYGACVDCGAAIPLRRLEAVPEAARCLDCETAFERSHGTVPASL